MLHNTINKIELKPENKTKIVENKQTQINRKLRLSNN